MTNNRKIYLAMVDDHIKHVMDAHEADEKLSSDTSSRLFPDHRKLIVMGADAGVAIASLDHAQLVATYNNVL